MIITRTPLRVSFVGGGTDIPCYSKQFGGAVLSCAINRYLYITANWRDDDRVVCSYSKLELLDREQVDKVAHSLIRECIKRVWIDGPNRGLEIHIIGELSTIGTGLGGSSAVAVGLLNALYHLKGTPIKRPEDIADEACIVELGIMSKHIGKQDQYACALGGVNSISFNDDNTVSFDRIKQKLPVSLFLTPIVSKERPLAESLLSEQNAKIAENTSTLDRMKAQVSLLEQSIKIGAHKRFIRILNEGWELKKKLSSSITSPEVDKMIDYIKSFGGGAKLCGAGASGYVCGVFPTDINAKAPYLFPVEVDYEGTKRIY